MTKQEEEKFDKKFNYENSGDWRFCVGKFVVSKSNIKKWIDNHDKREKERLIEDILNEIINTPIKSVGNSAGTQNKILNLIENLKKNL